MKNLYMFLLAITISIASFSQVPGTFNYQAIIRDVDGAVLANEDVILIARILPYSGSQVYSETYDTVTNQFGLVNLEIGSDKPSEFAEIDWSLGGYSLQIVVDGEIISTAPILTVPYAAHAKTIANGSVTSEKIVDGTILADDLASNSVGTSEIINESILAEDFNNMGASSGQVLKYYTYGGWAPANGIGSIKNMGDMYYNDSSEVIRHIVDGAAWLVTAKASATIHGAWFVYGESSGNPAVIVEIENFGYDIYNSYEPI